MINLLYCGNDKVFDGVLISLLSIMKYTKLPLNVYIMTMDLRELHPNNTALSREHSDYIRNVLKSYNEENNLTVIDITKLFKEDMKNSPNLKTSYTPYTLTRLYADLIPELPDKLLYLDTDTMANDDISSLFNYDIEDYEFAGVIDYLGKIFIRYNYMNAGILYLNLSKIRERDTFLKARTMCKTKKMFFPDQTALNRVVMKKKFLPVMYNEQRKLRKNTVIQHFCKSIRWFPFFHTVNYKPWNIDEIHSVYHLHAYDDILDEYVRLKKEYTEHNN